MCCQNYWGEAESGSHLRRVSAYSWLVPRLRLLTELQLVRLCAFLMGFMCMTIFILAHYELPRLGCMDIRSALSAVLLVAGLIMVAAGVAIMVLNPIRIEVYHKYDWRLLFEPVLMPPGEYRDVEFSYTLSKGVSFVAPYVELRLGRYRPFYQTQFNVSSAQCIFLSRSVLLEFHGAAPNRDGTLVIELYSCEEGRWGTKLLSKLCRWEPLSTEGSHRELSEVAKGVVRLEKGELLIEIADIIPAENITDECIRVEVSSPDTPIGSRVLSASIEERYRCNYTVDQPHLNVYPHLVFTPVPRDIRLDSRMFTLGLSTAVTGITLSVLSLVLQVVQLRRSGTRIDVENVPQNT